MGSEAGPTLGRRNVLPAERKRDGQLHALGRCIQEVEQCLTHVVRISDEDPVARKDAVEAGRLWSALLDAFWGEGHSCPRHSRSTAIRG